MSFGERLKHYRLLHHMNQSDLAEKLNVTSQAVSKWENNISEPEFQIIKRLTEIFKISYDELFSIDSRLAYQGKLFEVKKDQRLGKVYTFLTLFFSFLFVSLIIVISYTVQHEELPVAFPLSFGLLTFIVLMCLIFFATSRQHFQSNGEILFTIYNDRVEITNSGEVITFDEMMKISIRMQRFYENIGIIKFRLKKVKVHIRDVSDVSEVYSNLNKLKYRSMKGDSK